MNPSEQLLAAMTAAIDADGIPVALIPYQGAPPDAEFYLELMRDMINASGSATGAITFGTTDMSGMVPLTNVDPETALGLLLHMRQTGIIASVTWVVVADDTLRRLVEITPTKRTVSKEEDCLMVTCVVPDGPGWLAMQPYTKTPCGAVVWGEVETDHSSGDAGEVFDLMTELVTA
jgi:hypothetical protein